MKQSYKIFFLIFFVLFLKGYHLSAREQKFWQWVNHLGGSSWDIASGIVCTEKNDLYVTGSFFDTLFCENKKMAAVGGQDIFIARFDSKGSLEDLKTCGGKGNDQATCITVSKDNTVVIGGLVSENAGFDKFAIKNQKTSLFVAKLSDKGKFAWVSTLSASTGGASLNQISSDKSGTVFVAGVFTDTLRSGNKTVISNGKKDIFLARFSSTGHIEELKSFGGDEDDLPTALSVSTSDKIVFSGITTNPFLTDNQAVLNVKSSNSNAFLLSLDRNFEIQWKILIPSEEFCQIASLRNDLEENIYAVGSFTVKMSVQDSVLISKGYSDGFIIKYSPKGKRIWAHSFGTWYYDYASQLLVDNLGGALITGSVSDTLKIDGLQINCSSGKASALALQFSSSGKAIWGDCISGTGKNFSNGAVIDGGGNLYLTGTFRDEFIKGSAEIHSKGDQDVFVAKYYNCTPTEEIIQGDEILCPGSFTQLNIRHGYNHIIWNDSIRNTDYIIASKPGLFNVKMMDKRGCVLSDTATVMLANSKKLSLGPDRSVKVDKTCLLEGPKNHTNYLWQNGSNDDNFLAKADQGKSGTYTYWLSATDSFGCTNADTVNIEFYTTPVWLDLTKIIINIYPNPVENVLYWSTDAEKSGMINIEIVDDNGRIVYTKHVQDYQSGFRYPVDFSNNPSGLYYFNLKSGTGQTSKSFSIVKK